MSSGNSSSFSMPQNQEKKQNDTKVGGSLYE